MSDTHWPEKGIHYRMHPANMRCLTAAQIDCCVLANNHVLDWGYAGLAETLGDSARGWHSNRRRRAERGAGGAPATLEMGGKGPGVGLCDRTESSGIPRSGRRRERKAGVDLLADLSEQTAG